MPSWVKRKDGSMGEGLDDIEFKPEELKKDITKEVDEKVSAQFKTFAEENDKKMKPLLDMAASIAKDKADKEEAARKVAEKKQQEDGEITDEDFLLDPMGTIKKAQQPLQNALVMMAARANRRETLENLEYYHGDIKAKVDAMIDAQTLGNQTRSDVVLNCYKVVCHDHMKDINEGKIKARNSSLNFEGGSTGGHTGGEHKDGEETLTAEEKAAAKIFGLSDKQYAESRKELTYV